MVTQSCHTLCHSMDCSPPGCPVRGDSPSKNTGVVAVPSSRWIFPTQGSNPGLPHCRWIVYRLSHQASTRKLIQMGRREDEKDKTSCPHGAHCLQGHGKKQLYFKQNEVHKITKKQGHCSGCSGWRVIPTVECKMKLHTLFILFPHIFIYSQGGINYIN